MTSIHPPSCAVSNLQSYLDQSSKWTLHHLLEMIPASINHTYLAELMREYPMRGGKFFRSSLLYLCCELFEGSVEDALYSGIAYELFHNFALIHDDIEDESLIRRGKPTLHLQYGISLAINAGDALHGLVYQALMKNHERLGPEKTLTLLALFNDVAKQTFYGQALDIGWIINNIFPNAEKYQEMIGLKTGWYSGKGPAQFGGIIAGANDTDLQTLKQFGKALGLGFQVRDDILNLTVVDDTQPYGKERGGDIAEGKRTLIMIELFERINAEDSKKLRQVLSKNRIQVKDDEVQWCLDIAKSSGAIDAAIEYCEEQASIAKASLEKLPQHPVKSLLDEAVDYLAIDRIT